LIALAAQFNRTTDGTMAVRSEYLEVVITKRWRSNPRPLPPASGKATSCPVAAACEGHGVCLKSRRYLLVRGGRSRPVLR
jgi:hypothetical protein